MMTDFLVALGKVNLAMGAAIILVSLLRRPLRAQFGAPIAYAIWFLVPVAGMASLLPPRVVVPLPLAPITPVYVPAAPASVMGHIAHSALGVTDQLAGQGALIHSVPPAASATAMPDTALLLLLAWVLGGLLMAIYLTRLQLRFSAAARLGKAGPAVLGFLSPRIVTPDGFQTQFTAQEQAAILAHERVHLARQDARINALAAFLRCLCWFNPLIHLGARWLRIDQELACDATAVAAGISRRDYAKALLKSQLVVTSLPLGCNWPGSQHPLIERIALLKRKPPGTARRLAGASLVLLAATLAGISAWAAQPPVAAKPVAARPRMVLAALPAMAAAPGQTAQEPVANPDTASSGSDGDASRIVRADGAVSATPAPPRTVSIEAQAQFVLTALPQIASISEPPKISDQMAYPMSQNASLEPKEASATAAGPRTRTEAALGCLLGFGSWKCATGVATHWSWCGEQYEQRWVGDCPQGPLEKVDYLGTNAAGADVYEVQYRHEDTTAIVEPSGPDGKANVRFKSGNPNGIIPSSLIDVSSSAAHKMTLYATAESAAGGVTAANAASGAASVAATEPVVMPNTPDGGGDPDTIVCRAPQRIAGANQFGEEACGHNYEWQKLALNGKDLAPDDKTLIPRATVANPTGKGDPDGVTCRTSGFFSPNPPLCRTNRFWANLIKNHQTVYDDGVLATRGPDNNYDPFPSNINNSFSSSQPTEVTEHTGGH